MTDREFEKKLGEYRDTIQRALYSLFENEVFAKDPVGAAMVYSVKNGGKRLRPAIMLEACSVLGGQPRDVLPYACALELIHCYSLVHDDLPCMDDSDLRRGNPSVHKKFGEWQALLAGDGILNFAFETVLDKVDPQKIGADIAWKCLKELASASGIYGMVGGQALDLRLDNTQNSISPQTLIHLQEKKTGALIAAAGRIGAIAARADDDNLKTVTDYCRDIGLSFQITDDILDSSGNQADLGKPSGKDFAANKATFVTLLGESEAKRRVHTLTASAICKAQILNSGFFERLAIYISGRKN